MGEKKHFEKKWENLSITGKPGQPKIEGKW